MKTLKKTLCLVLAVVMVVGVMVLPASADYNDADEIEYKEAVDVLTGLGVIDGMPSGGFEPDGTLTREQAAKIVTYMLLGKDNAEKLGKNQAIFTDVAAGRWSAGYIAYCAQMGILSGVGGGKFDPEGKLTGSAFGKMLLVSLGYDADQEGYKGASWEINVATDMISAGIDVAGTVFSDELTREQAAEMAFQTLTADMVQYTGRRVEVNGVVIEGNPATAIEVDLDRGNYSGYYTTAPGYGTLQFCEKYFSNLRTANSYDAFGRPDVIWYRGNTNNIIAAKSEEAVLTYTGPVTEQKLMADLGKTNYLDVTYVVDGNASALRLRRSNTANLPESGNGVLTEVFFKNDAYTVTFINEYLAKVTKVTPANEANGTQASVDLAPVASNLKTTDLRTVNGVNMTGVLAEGFEVNDIVRVTVGDSGIETLEKVTPVTAAVTVRDTANAKVTVGGTQYSFSKKATPALSSDFDPTASATTYNLYLDSYGNILGYDKPAAAASDLDVVFVKAASINATKDNINGMSVDARVQVVYMDGTTEVLPLTVKTAGTTDLTAAIDDTKSVVTNWSDRAAGDKLVTIPNASGTKTAYYEIAEGNSGVAANQAIVTALVNNVFTYSVKDGVISLNGKVTDGKTPISTSAVTLTEGQTIQLATGSAVVTVSGGVTLYATTNTQLVLVASDGSVAKYTGYGAFPNQTYTDAVAAASYKQIVYISTSANVVSKILVVGAGAVANTKVDAYGYYIGAGIVTGDGQQYDFWVNGEKQSYLLADSFDDDDALVVGKVLALTFDDNGDISGVDGTKSFVDNTSAKTSVITTLTDTYMIMNDSAKTVVYLDSSAGIFNVTVPNTCTADVLEAGDNISYAFTTDANGKNTLKAAYIIPAPTPVSPTKVELGVGSANAVTIAGAPVDLKADTVTTATVTNWIRGTNDRIKLTVEAAANTTVSVTIGGQPYTSGDDYVITTTGTPITDFSVTVVITVTDNLTHATRDIYKYIYVTPYVAPAAG